MADDIRRRAACDRCHSQKIRCPRQPGQAACSRCVKSGSQCIFSPFRQKKTTTDWSSESPLGVQDAIQDSLHTAMTFPGTPNPGKRRRVALESATPSNHGISTPQIYEPFNVDDMSLDWSQDAYPFSQDLVDPSFCQVDVNFGSSNMFSLQADSSVPKIVSLLNNDIDLLSQTRKETNAILPLGDAPHLDTSTDDRSPEAGTILGWNIWPNPNYNAKLDSISNCIKKLSTLSSDLFEHKQTIPPLSIHDPDYVGSANPLHPGVDDYSKYVVEETFRLTQNLIDIYPTFLRLFINNNFQARFLDPLSPDSTPPFSSTNSNSSNSSTPTTAEDIPSTSSPPRTTTKLPLDHPSILLLTSCHLRTIEIYNELFAHMAVCIRQKGIVPTHHQAQLKTPQLSIGNYIPPPSSAVPMQMLLLVQFASQLSAFANDLERELEERGEVGNGEGEEKMMEVTRAVVGNIKERAGGMAKELSRLRGALLNAGILA